MFCIRSGFSMEDKRTGFGDISIEREKFVENRADADRLFDQWVNEDGRTENHGNQFWYAIVEMLEIDEEGEAIDEPIREFRSPTIKQNQLTTTN